MASDNIAILVGTTKGAFLISGEETQLADYRAALLRETGCEPSHALLSLGRRIEADAAKVRPASPCCPTRATLIVSSPSGRRGAGQRR